MKKNIYTFENLGNTLFSVKAAIHKKVATNYFVNPEEGAFLLLFLFFF